MFELVKLQSWFGEKRGRFWIVDLSKQDKQERRRRRARTYNVREEADDLYDLDHGDPSTSDEGDQDNIDDQIVQDIEQWKAEA